MPVQQHVLNWLYSVLTSEYHDLNRTYSDVARLLDAFPSLAPRTDVHTFPNGTNALLLHVSGTIPVVFRGSTYRFPLSIWVPHAYPREPPLVYVTPTQTMVVRPGQHVDPQGQVYHPYLFRWCEFWDKSTLEDFLAVLTDVFAKEPPVISRQTPGSTQTVQTRPTPPPVPPLPPEMGSGSPIPPQRALRDSHPTPARSQDGGQRTISEIPPRQGTSGSAPVSSSTHSRYDSAPPLPPEAQGKGPWGQGSSHSHPDTQTRSASHVQPQLHVAQISTPQVDPRTSLPAQIAAQWTHDAAAQPPFQHWHSQVPPPAWNGAVEPEKQQQPRQAAPIPPNILDEPLTLQVPEQATVVPPPIPPNPEKDALLQQLAHTLASMRQRSREQNESSLAGLKAQKMAMQAAVPALQSEMSQLTQLSNLLASNTHILHEALHKAGRVIESSKHHPAPDVDELLVAPTVVSNQLYTLVAEERALGEAIFMLGRAVERGRISPTVFAKTTRSLAREWYLKKALARKIGVGMGINVA